MKKTIFTILAFMIIVGASWLLTCGMIWLIALCFGLKFTWAIATGIWLTLTLLNLTFNVKSNKK